MQQGNYSAAEVVYHKAQVIDPDANKACNLCHCLIKQGRPIEAKAILEDILQCTLPGSADLKCQARVKELLLEIELEQPVPSSTKLSLEDAFLESVDQLMTQRTSFRTRRLPIFEEISSLRDQLAC